MKKTFILILYLFITFFLSAAPFSETCHKLNANVSVDFLTRASILTDSVWYSTIMPAYNINYQFNLLSKNKKFHRFSLNARYFSSNRFNLNTVELEKGENSICLVNIDLEYLRYLPIALPVSFIIGCSITPEYSYYGQRIAPGRTVEIKDFFISLGPVCGFSVYKSDFFEFYSLIGIKLGLPIYSELKYPDESAEELNHFSINGIIRNEINFYIRRINIGLGYSFYLDGSIDVEKNTEILIPSDTNITTTHSISLLFGVIF